MATGKGRRVARYALAGGAAAALCAFALSRAAAEHFNIVLRASCGASTGMSFMDTTPPIGGVNKRPVVIAHPGDPVRIEWSLKSGYPHGVMKDVGVHFFVVREDAIGQKPVPNPAGPAGIVDNALTMDFGPTGTAEGFLRMKAPEAGNYLIRVQTENTYQEHGHEHFSAIDLQVR